MSYVGSVLHSVAAIDKTRLRGWSALRRGILVVLTFGLFTWLFGQEIGALASVASLFVGLQDRHGPANYATRVMVVESMVLAVATLLGGFFSSLFAAVILVACAFISGVIAQHDKSVSRMFSDVLQVSAFLALSSMTRMSVLEAALAVFIGGLLQALMTRATARWSSDLPERRPVAKALIAVADHLDDAQQRAKTTTGPAAEAAVVEADSAISSSDLAHDRRRGLRKLLADAEVLRWEASAIRVRNALEVAQIRDPEVDAARDLASVTLRASARALTALPRPGLPDTVRDAALEEIDQLTTVSQSLADDVGARPTARAIARQALRIGRHTRRVLGAQDVRNGARSIPVGDHVVDEIFHPGVRDIRSGVRLAFAAALGLSLAAVFNLPHGAWVAATAVALLRPDYRALTSDTVARAMGVTIGAAVVVPLVAITDSIHFIDVILLLLMSCAAFAVTSANEGLFVIAITLQTVYTRAVVGEDPVQVAENRLMDVLIGCLIAVLLLLLMPLREGRILGRELADYAAAAADWMGKVASATSGDRPKGFKKATRRMRTCRVAVQHGLDVRRIEPLGPGVSHWRGQAIFTRIHDSARAAGAAALSLSHGAHTCDTSAVAAANAAATLQLVAKRLQRKETELPIVVEYGQSPDDVCELLVRADQEALAAFEAINAAEPPQARQAEQSEGEGTESPAS